MTFKVVGSRDISKFINKNERQVLNFNTKWKFINTDDSNAKEMDYDDGEAEMVSLPHLNKKLDLFHAKPSDWEEIVWYRRHFNLPKACEGSIVKVYFDGGGQVNKIYVNGAYVGTAKGTFTHFEFDITEYISFGEYDNVIAIQVDSTAHTELPPGIHTDFYFFGGLHGEATMTIMDALYLSDVFYYTCKQSDEKYTAGTPVNLVGKIQVTNSYEAQVDSKVNIVVKDQESNPVSQLSQSLILDSGETKEVSIVLPIEDPHLWSPDTPYLYDVETTVFKDDLKVDNKTIRTGLRWITTTGRSGDKPIDNPDDEQILLNDQPIIIYGINKHMQFPYIGNAGTRKLNVKDAYTIRYDLGMNLARTAHYQNHPNFLQACDEIGLLVEEEALSWNDTPNRPQHKYSVEEMIKRDRNHPSIILWSIIPNEDNEIDYPLDERKALHTRTKELDPTRLTCQDENQDLTFVTDVYNRHDYSPKKLAPKYQPYIVGEWNTNLGESFIIPNDSEDRKIDQFITDGIRQARFMADETIDGYIKWDMTGYLTPSNYGKYGKNVGVYRCSGAYGVFKDPMHGFWQASQFRSQAEPQLVGHVLELITEWKSDSSSTIYVTSNAQEVELFVGDESKGRIQPNYLHEGEMKLWQPIFKWENIEWSEEKNLRAIGYDACGNKVSEAIKYPTAYDIQPKEFILHNVTSIDYDSEHYKVYGAPANFGQKINGDGSDLAYIIGELQDANGQRVYYGQEDVTLEIVEGPGKLIYGDKLYMVDGLVGFYLQSEYGKIGETKIKASVDVGQLINQEDDRFEFEGNWLCEGDKAYAYGQDYRESTTEGDRVTITFEGTRARVYGRAAIHYGTAEVFVDNQSQGSMSFKTGEEKFGEIGFQSLYETPILEEGIHTITIVAQADSPIAIDALKVFDGKVDIESQPICIKTVVGHEPEVPINEMFQYAPKLDVVSKGELKDMIDSVKALDLKSYTYKDAIELEHAIASGEKLYQNEKVSQEQLKEGICRLNDLLQRVQPQIMYVPATSITDTETNSNIFYLYAHNPNTWGTGDKYIYANKDRTKGDYASLNVKGVAVKLYGRKTPNSGWMEVVCNTDEIQRINAYSEHERSNVLFFEKSGLTPEEAYNIKVVVTNETGGNPDNANVQIEGACVFLIKDAFDKFDLRQVVDEVKKIDLSSSTQDKVDKVLQVLKNAKECLLKEQVTVYETKELLKTLQQVKQDL